MNRDDERLMDMLAFATEAIDTARTASRSDLETDRVLALALVKLVETVGEAAAGVSEARRATLPAIPWRQIIGTRHRLVHDYRAFDRDVLWSILREDLPRLVAVLKGESGE